MRIDSALAATGDLPAAAARASAADAAAAPVQGGRDVPAAELDAAIQAANQAMRQMSVSITFQKDESSGRMVAVVIDSETNKVLRELPSKDMLALSQSIDRMLGLLVHQEA